MIAERDTRRKRGLVAALVVVVVGVAALLLSSGARAVAGPTCAWSPLSYVSVVEGDSGTTPASISLACTNPTALTYTVHFHTVDGSAVSPDDFVAAAGDVSVPPGSSSSPIVVEIVGDTRPEATEVVRIALEDPSGAVGLPSDGLITIADDDGFSVSAVSRSVREGDGGSTAMDIEVRLSDPLDQPLDLELHTEDGTATAGSDYEPTNETVTFQPGEVSKRLSVTIYGDTDPENDETVLLELSTQGRETLDSGTLTILDDDRGPGTCILLSDTAASLSAPVSTPSTDSLSGDARITVTNCGHDVNLQLRGTDASGPGSAWQLSNASSGKPTNLICDLGLNIFRASALAPDSVGGGVGIGLSTQDRTLPDPVDGVGTPFLLAAGASHDLLIGVGMPCAGSDGIGQPMTTTVTLTAVTP